MYKGQGREWGREKDRPCATMFNLLGFITTVSVMANTHCMMDGLVVACLTPPEPSLALHANRAINGLPIHAVRRHLYQWSKQELMTERLFCLVLPVLGNSHSLNSLLTYLLTSSQSICRYNPT